MDEDPCPVDVMMRRDLRTARERRMSETAASAVRDLLRRGDTVRGVERLDEAGALDD